MTDRCAAGLGTLRRRGGVWGRRSGFRSGARTVRWRASALGVITIAELLLLLAALIPAMGATTPLDSGEPVHLSYLWWTGTATKPGVDWIRRHAFIIHSQLRVLHALRGGSQ